MSTIEFNNMLTGLHPNLTYFATTLTNDYEEARDLVQDTMLKALMYRDKFEPDTNLKAWTFTIMKNTFINNYRRSVKSNTIVDHTQDLYFINSVRSIDYESPESIISHKNIQSEIDRLEDEHRVPFEMHNAGYKYKEIADHLQLSIGTVKSRIFFSRKKLMKRLKDHE